MPPPAIRRYLHPVRHLGMLIALSLLAGCGGSVPTEFKESYTTDRVVIRDFIGSLTIATGEEGSEVLLQVSATQAQLDLLPIKVSGGVLTIEWEGAPNRRRLWFEFWRGRWMADLNRLDDYPTMILTIPASVELDVGNIIGNWTIGDRDGRLAFEAERGSGSIGAARTAEISISGDADIEIGPVSGLLEVSVAGSGSVTGEGAAGAAVSLAGSGEVALGDVEGQLSVGVAGSGSVRVGRAATAEIAVSGSGNVSLGAVGQVLTIAVQGSGSVVADGLNGAFEASLSGSGQVAISEGRGEPFRVTIAGSGNVTFDGIGVDPNVSISGSGNLFLGAVEGELTSSTTGSGRVQIAR